MRRGSMRLPVELICAANGGTTILTPWMPRFADNARLTYEVVATIGTPQFTVEVREKNREDVVRDGAALSLSWTDTVVGNTTFWTVTASNLKELVRFAITLEASDVGLEGVFFRLFEPTWFNTATVV